MTLEQDDTQTDPNPSIANLRKEERRWFSWLSVLHECVGRADTPNGEAILEIARRRWLRARGALRRQDAGEWATDN
jgi:hypothetical protein